METDIDISASEYPACNVSDTTRRSVGDWGESCARSYLRSHDWRILDSNWHTRRGEIDIVAWDPHRACVVVVEVKTRRGHDALTALEAVTPQKLQRLRLLAIQWMRTHGTAQNRVAIDVIAINAYDADYSITHVKDV